MKASALIAGAAAIGDSEWEQFKTSCRYRCLPSDTQQYARSHLTSTESDVGQIFFFRFFFCFSFFPLFFFALTFFFPPLFFFPFPSLFFFFFFFFFVWWHVPVQARQCSTTSAADEGWRFVPVPTCLGIGGHPSGSRQGHPQYTGA